MVSKVSLGVMLVGATTVVTSCSRATPGADSTGGAAVGDATGGASDSSIPSGGCQDCESPPSDSGGGPGGKRPGGAGTGAAGGERGGRGGSTGEVGSGGGTGGGDASGGTGARDASGGVAAGGFLVGGVGGNTFVGGTSGSGAGIGGIAGSGGGGSADGGTSGVGGGVVLEARGPCDIYADSGQPCVAAYSMIRRLRSSYTGPLYQVRADSSAQNTGVGGTTHDVATTSEGFADVATHDTACAGTTCTISRVYDQSGNGNDLLVAESNPVEFVEIYETLASGGPLKVGGHDVYSLYTERFEGYRTASEEPGVGLPLDTEPQSIYVLVDGTHSGSACCWEFGQSGLLSTDYGHENSLVFGVAYWGRGAGSGPWFMADFGTGVFAGGTLPLDPGWAEYGGSSGPPNEYNPSMAVPFALGFLKTGEGNWALRMADLQTDTEITTAYQGGLPTTLSQQGGVVLGMGSENSANSWGTFFEGAIVSGWPADETELAVMQNVQSAGYGE